MKNWLYGLSLLLTLAASNEALVAASRHTECHHSLNKPLFATSESLLHVSHRIETVWPNGYQVSVALTNHSDQPTTNWHCSFKLPSGQTISSIWNGVAFHNGDTHIVKNPVWAGGNIIPPGQTVTFGMIVYDSKGGDHHLNHLEAHANRVVPSDSLIPNNEHSQNVLKHPFLESYWESWNSVSSFTSIAKMKTDVVSISFGKLINTGAHTFEVGGLDADEITVNRFVDAAHGVGKKIKISIGGPLHPLSAEMKTIEDALGVAHAIVQYVQEHHLDGVDLDIEDYPNPSIQIALIQNLRLLLGTNSLISYTSKAPASTTFPYSQVIHKAHMYLTSVIFMAYDYKPGYSYQQDIQGLLSLGVPSGKIVIGLMPGNDDLNIFTSIDDIRSAANYIIEKKLGGIMFWDLNRDHENKTGLGVDAVSQVVWNIFHP